MEKLHRLKDVAKSWDVDYSTLYRWVQADRLEAVKLPGGALRVRDSEVRRVLGEASKEPVTA